MPVVDASVYVSIINSGEKDHARSWAWFEESKASLGSIVAPVLLLAEVAAVLSRGVGDKALAHQVVEHLRQSGMIEFVPVTLAMAECAATTAADHRIRGCDAIYIALAEQMNQPLVTLDRQQLERAPSFVIVCKP